MTMKMRFILSIAALLITLAACSIPAKINPGQAAQNASRPGWTGRTLVTGSNSTVSGDAEATYRQQKWGVGRQR